jgi:hypothetical protein
MAKIEPVAKPPPSFEDAAATAETLIEGNPQEFFVATARALSAGLLLLAALLETDKGNA